MSITWTRPDGSGQAFAPATAAPPGAPPAARTPLEAAAEAVSPQAADTVAQMRAVAADILVSLYEYLAAHVERHPGLAPAIPALSDAVAQHRAGQAADPFAGARSVYAVIQAARRADPSIPEA